MEFEELFETRDKHRGNNREERFPSNTRSFDNSVSSSDEKDDRFNWLIILEKIKSDKRLRILAILGGLMVFTILIVLIVVLLPLILKLINNITQNGLQGIFDKIIGL